jgi:hypothetical protein
MLLSAAALFFLTIVFAQYARSLLMMNYSFRFFVPYFPILLLLLALIADQGAAQWSELRYVHPERFRFALGLLLLFGGVQVAIYAFKLRGEVAYVRLYREVLESQHVRAGTFLRDQVSASDWISVYEDAGAIPYLAEAKTVDFGRLNDETLARVDHTPAQIADYFFTVSPAAAVFTSLDFDRVDYDEGASAIVGDPRFEDYELARRYRSEGALLGRRCFELVYLRRDYVVEGDEGKLPRELTDSTLP